MLNDTALRDTAPQAAPPAADNRPRGFPGLFCWGCGEDDTLNVRLCDNVLVCKSCEGEFTVEEVKSQSLKLAALARWMDAAPVIE